MRVLLGCSLGGLGHLTPVVAAARALRELGHETVVLVPPSLSEAAADSGIDFRVGAEPPRAAVDELWERVRAGPPEAVYGLMDRELFADRCTVAMLGAAERLCGQWGPRLIVREPCEYATAVMAHRLDIRQLQLGISQSAIEHQVLAIAAETVQRHGTGVAAAIGAAPYLTPFPASLDPSPWPETHRYRNSPIAAPPIGDWWPGNGAPLIYVTFGSVLGHLPEARSVYRAALDAVAQLPVRVLMTVGRAIDPASLGPVAPHVHIERWVAQDSVFPHARAVVCHGGSGTVFGALAAGLPLVVCPLFADQSANARTVQGAGAGVVVNARDRATGAVRSLGPDDVAALRAAIRAVLRSQAHRTASACIARELAGVATLRDTLAGLIPARDQTA